MNTRRRGIVLLSVLALALVCVTPAVLADQGLSNQNNRTLCAELFAVLPDGAISPEGLAVGPDNNIYVASFGFNQNGGVTGLGQFYVFNPDGRFLRQVSIAGSSPHPLIAFHPQTGALLVADLAEARCSALIHAPARLRFL